MKSLFQRFRRAKNDPSALTHQTQSQVPLFSQPPPQDLGIQPWIPELPDLVARLENSLDQEWLAHVKRRVLASRDIDEIKYEWMLFELKRFFILCAVLKNVSMYSDEADLIWHEMLMHTRDYNSFCEHFIGQFIHHQPNLDKDNVSSSDMQEQRALHDLVYSFLFHIYPESTALLRPFFRFSLSEDVLRAFETSSNETVREQYFNRSANGAVQSLQHSLIDLIRSKYGEAKAEKAASVAAPTVFDPLTVMLLLSASSHQRDSRSDSSSSCTAGMAPIASVDHNNDGSGPGGDGDGGGGSAGAGGGGGDAPACGGACGGCGSG